MASRSMSITHVEPRTSEVFHPQSLSLFPVPCSLSIHESRQHEPMPPSDSDYDERSGGPERIYPPRLREIEAAEAEERGRHDQRRRKRWVLGVALALLIPAIFLLYGLIDRNVIHPPVERPAATAPMTVEADEEIQVSVQNACGR